MSTKSQEGRKKATLLNSRVFHFLRSGYTRLYLEPLQSDVGVVGTDSGHGDAGHFVFCEANGYSGHGHQRARPNFPG